MVLNVDQCKVITFSRKKLRLNYDYKVNKSSLKKVNCSNDLGVTIDSQLRFNIHLDTVINNANRRCGFIKRQTNELANIDATRLLVLLIIRPFLEKIEKNY